MRLLTGDDPEKKAASTALFQRANGGELILHATETAIADAIYVMTSARLYQVTRQKASQLLMELMNIAQFDVTNKDEVMATIDVYGTTNLDYGDARNLVAMSSSGIIDIYSFDQDYDKFPEFTRIDPRDESSSQSAGQTHGISRPQE